MKFEDLPNYRKSEVYRNNYQNWKEDSLIYVGYFPIFQSFKEDFLLRDLSGNAIKLYIYLGLHAGNKTGETWVTIENIAKYFEKSPRAISYWIEELVNCRLIERIQLKYDESAHTFLIPYGRQFLLDKKIYKEIRGTEND